MSGTPMEIFKHEEELKKMQLDIPFALKFSNALQKEGVFDHGICTLEGVVDELCRLKQTN